MNVEVLAKVKKLQRHPKRARHVFNLGDFLNLAMLLLLCVALQYFLLLSCLIVTGGQQNCVYSYLVYGSSVEKKVNA